MGGGRRTEPGDPQDTEAAGLMTNPEEGESVVPLTFVNDEHAEGRTGQRRQCIPVQTVKNHKIANTLLPVVCGYRRPKRTKATRTKAVNTEAEPWHPRGVPLLGVEPLPTLGLLRTPVSCRHQGDPGGCGMFTPIHCSLPLMQPCQYLQEKMA